MLLVPNGSPYRRTSTAERMRIAEARVAETGLPLVYVNQFGGQDELVFDGGSFALSAGGERVMSLPTFEDALALSTWERAAMAVGAAPQAPRKRRMARTARGLLSRHGRRPAGLCAQVGLQGCAARPFGRGGFGDQPGGGARRARRGERAGGDAALALHQPGQPGRRRRLRSAQRSASRRHRHLARRGRPDRNARTGVRGSRAGHHRGEPAGPHQGRHPDGDVQQAGRDADDDRQQVGDGGGLRHALRRHVRRLQCVERPLQGGGLRRLRLAQRQCALWRPDFRRSRSAC